MYLKPWIEKYKPKTFEDFKYHYDIIKSIKSNIKSLPNLIFSGPPGCGKTTLINIICNDIYKTPDVIKRNCLFLNASDERGISDVKNKIKNFSIKSVYKNYDFKIIVLDEADTITYEAQAALRRVIEDYSDITRFCFICNYDDKIINPIVSRCVKYNFTKNPKKIIADYLMEILEKEDKVEHAHYIDAIVNYTNGDLRKSIILMETFSKINKKLTKEEFYDLIGIVKESELVELLTNLNKDNIYESAENFIKKSHPLKNLITAFANYVLNNKDIPENKKVKVFFHLSKYDNMIYKNIDSELILINILNNFYRIMNDLL